VLAQGVRISDQMQLQNENVVPAGGEEAGRIEYEMQKSGKAKSVRLVPNARAIVRRWWAPEAGPRAYVFPYLRTHTTKASVNAYYNRQLQAAAEDAGITKHLTAHVARHTFANIAVADGWSIQEIQAALGHSTLRTTQQYIQQLQDQDLDDRMRGTFG
jgi:integrase